MRSANPNQTDRTSDYSETTPDKGNPKTVTPPKGDDRTQTSGENGTNGLASVPKILFSSTMPLAKRFICIAKYSNLTATDAVPTHVITAIQDMFNDYGITEWQDLALFDLTDIDAFFNQKACKDITIRNRKSMGYLLKYVKLENELPNEALNLTDIISKVENIPDNRSYQPINSTTHTSHQYTKKTVPDLDEFKGTNQDSFG